MHILIAVCAIIALTASEDAQIVNVKHDTLGNYDVQYMVDGISKVEQRTADGNVYGGYSFVDPNGIVRKTAYTSGVQGFHAVSPDIPIPVQDTPEVALAKSQHLELIRGAHLANGQVIFPNKPITSLPVEKLIKTEITPTAAVESIPIPRLEKTYLPHELSLPVTQKLIESVPFAGKVLRTNDIALQPLLLGTDPSLFRAKKIVTGSSTLVKGEVPLLRTDNIRLEPLALNEKFIQTPFPLVRIGQESDKLVQNEEHLESSFVPQRSIDIRNSQIAVEPEKIVKTGLPVVRDSDIALEALRIPEKVIQSSVPLIRTGQLSISENVENSILKANSIALESIPLSPSSSLLRDGPFAKESVQLSERIIKSQIPVFHISDLNRKSVPISREYFTQIPASKWNEGHIESLVRLENPFHRIVDLPRSEIVLDPLKFAGNNVRIVRTGDEGFRKILLH